MATNIGLGGLARITASEATAVAGQPANATQAVLQGIQQANSRLDMILDRLHRVSTRAFGGSTGKAEGTPPKPVPAGEFGAINEQLVLLESYCATIETAVTEIDKIV